jgi:hypothetical protein
MVSCQVLVFLFVCSLGMLFLSCRFEAMNHFAGLKLPRHNRCFTATTTSSAPKTSKSWPKEGNIPLPFLLFYFFAPLDCFTMIIVITILF